MDSPLFVNDESSFSSSFPESLLSLSDFRSSRFVVRSSGLASASEHGLPFLSCGECSLACPLQQLSDDGNEKLHRPVE